jgi:hypothetical protein
LNKYEMTALSSIKACLTSGRLREKLVVKGRKSVKMFD